MTKHQELVDSPGGHSRSQTAYRLANAWLETWVLGPPPFEAAKSWVTVGLLRELMRAHMPGFGELLSQEAVVAALQDLHIPMRPSPLGVQTNISGATLLGCTEAIPAVRAAARRALLNGPLLIVAISNGLPPQPQHRATHSIH